jgi:hypothetical protein
MPRHHEHKFLLFLKADIPSEGGDFVSDQWTLDDPHDEESMNILDFYHEVGLIYASIGHTALSRKEAIPVSQVSVPTIIETVDLANQKLYDPKTILH